MITLNFDRGNEDAGRIDVSLSTLYGQEYVWTDLAPAVGGFGLTAEQARFYAAGLVAHADALDERNTQPVVIRHKPSRRPRNP